MKKSFLLPIFLLAFYPVAFGQTIFEGRVVSVKGTPISNVSISVHTLSSKNIIAFDISKTNGSFKIALRSTDNLLVLKASILGYKVIEDTVSNVNLVHDFVLTPAAVTLKEVTVTNRPIRQEKDTVNYLVQSFASKEDRSISDVIKKLPGMEVRDDGTILYQGKSIQAFLVNGLDLLEGRYSLASNNLPHDAVKNIQLIENDQRIKVLDSLVFSDRTTLNIQLKKFMTTGMATIGTGVWPLLWDVTVTPITYNKTFQAINSYQGNNLGKDKSSQLRVLASDYIFESTSRPHATLLAIQQIPAPPFDQQLWLDNNMHLFTSNILKVLKKNLQVKFTVSFINDYQRRDGSTNTLISIPGQNISLSEIQQNGLNRNNLKAGFTLEKNTKQVFLKNIFSFEREWTNATDKLVNGTKNIFERVSGDPISLSNKLSLITPLGSQLVTINSTVLYNTSSQALNIFPGQYDSILNGGKTYEEVIQHFIMKTFQTTNYLGFVKGFRRITVAPKFGFELQNQELTSSINTVNLSAITDLGKDFNNRLSLLKAGLFQELNAQYKSRYLNSGFTIRVSEQRYTYEDRLLQTRNAFNRVLIEPRVNFKVNIRQNYDLVISGSADNNIGEISQLYTAYILQSYRRLQRLNATLPENMNLSTGIGLNYKEALTGFFYNISFLMGRNKKNLVFANKVNADGSSTLQSIVQDNIQDNTGINGSVSKYIAGIKTIFKIKGSLNFISSEQYINSILNNIKTTSSNIGVSVTNSSLKHIGFVYDGSFQFSQNRLNNQVISGIRLQQHDIKINFFPATGHMFTVNTKYYYNSQRTTANKMFVNLLYRFSTKKKIDFEAYCNNLLNTRYFTTAFSDGYLTIENIFHMRPTNFVVAARFPF